MNIDEYQRIKQLEAQLAASQKENSTLKEANESFLQATRMKSYICPLCADAMNDGYYNSAKKALAENENLREINGKYEEALKEIMNLPITGKTWLSIAKEALATRSIEINLNPKATANMEDVKDSSIDATRENTTGK